MLEIISFNTDYIFCTKIKLFQCKSFVFLSIAHCVESNMSEVLLYMILYLYNISLQHPDLNPEESDNLATMSRM